MHIFIAGPTGFNGANAADRLFASDHQVTSIHNLNGYYDLKLILKTFKGMKWIVNFNLSKATSKNQAFWQVFF